MDTEAPARPKTELRRVTIHEHDDRLRVMTLRGVGFSWRCTCGARGRVRSERTAALHDKALHEAGHH
jgi:hypothetical protein